MSLSNKEMQNLFDFLELKRGKKLGCSVCGGNDWSGRKVVNIEREVVGPEKGFTYVRLICKNCKQVLWFTDKVLAGPWS